MSKLSAVCLLALGALCAPAFAAPCNGVTTNLVANCGFETGDFTSWTGTATTGSPNYTGVDNGDPFSSNPTPYEGVYEAYLGTLGTTSTLTQTLSTVNGQSYTIQFALLNDTSAATPYSNSFAATFGGISLFSESGVAANAYTLYSFTGVATGSSTALSFTDRNDTGYFELDSVSVTPGAASSAPEISASGAAEGLVLLLGGALVLRRGRLFGSNATESV